MHATGLREVARIEAEQDALARQAGLADRQAYYAVRERRFAPVAWTDSLRDEYLRQANAFVGQVRKRLPAAFHSLPAYAMEVVREPAFSEMAGGPAHASPPSMDGTRPGRVYVHLAGKTEDPAAMYTLMCHEAVPGHVMHGDIQVRQTGLPMFRKTAGYVALVEGWGLYAEALCKEMGAFPDIAADFMRSMPSCSGPRGWWSIPACMPRAGARPRRWPTCMTPAASHWTRRARRCGATSRFQGRRPATRSAC